MREILPAPRILGLSTLVLEISPLLAKITQGPEGTRETSCLWGSPEGGLSMAVGCSLSGAPNLAAHQNHLGIFKNADSLA